MVLDMCCGTRMMWFDKKDARCIYVDVRNENFRPTGAKFAEKDIEVRPDVQADFKRLPFRDGIFDMVSFDPPHIVRRMANGNVTKYYGILPQDWKKEIRLGFVEGFRVLKLGGTMIFKWSEVQFPVSDVLRMTSEKPLFGNRSGKTAGTHWIVFIKEDKDGHQGMSREIAQICL